MILQARTTLNKVIKSCARCAILRTKPLLPEMAALPQCRVSPWQRPFTYTGTDVFRPINVAIGRRKEKRWGIIFTCLTTRAVYLDVIASLTAVSCMRAMDGLAARRGPVEERLRWLLSRAEYLINSRPLIDEGSTMTPNDLLLGPSNERTNDDDQPADTRVEDFMAERERWVQGFWQWWTAAYLPTLAIRSKWRTKPLNLAVGDVVFICEDDYRYGWRKGRVVEVRLDGESGQVRRVVVRTADGNLYRRHASKVAPIVRVDSFGKGECKE